MIAAPKPQNEAARIWSLQRLDLLDTMPEAQFDALTRIASRVCGTPIALISLVDEDRQWFKSRVGLDVEQTDRSAAFCAHAILEPGTPFVVPDAGKDERFADNPLVTDAPHVTFYAGVPLASPTGPPIGTLCVIDTKPRELSPDQLATLQDLALQVEVLFKAREQRIRHERMLRDLQATHSLLAHDLKAPARQIRGLLEVLTECHPTDPDFATMLDLSLQAADRLQMQLKGLFRYTQVRNQGTLECVDSADLARKAWQGMEGSAPAVIDLQPLPNVPSYGIGLYEVFVNLLANALAHSDKPTPHVTVSCRPSHGWWRFEITDDGPGIEETHHAHIFKLFGRSEPSEATTSDPQGSGVGLSIVEWLVADVGGKCGVESIPGEGATFWFTWPPHSSAPAGSEKRPVARTEA